jgi:hypothetical protein
VAVSRDFAETMLLEAVARRVRADLVVGSGRQTPNSRLISRFLGLEEPDGVVLEVPRTVDGELVYLPDGHRIGLSWQIADKFIQGTSEVIGHPQFLLKPPKRVDSLMVRRPEMAVLTNRRRETRHRLKRDETVRAELWLERDLLPGRFGPPHPGRLIDMSANGLGVALATPVTWEKGSKLLVGLRGGPPQSEGLYRAVLAYCITDKTYEWRAGLSSVQGVQPGELPALTEALLHERDIRRGGEA